VLLLCTQTRVLVSMPLALQVDPIRAAFSLSDTQFSLVQGYAQSIPFVLAAPLWGLAADRWSQRNLLAASMVIVGCASIGTALATDLWQLLAWRAVVGAGGAAIFPLAVTLITARFDAAMHGRALGVFYAGVGLSPGLGALAAGAMIEQAGTLPPEMLPAALRPWQVTFLLTGLLVLGSALLLLTVRDAPRRRASADAAPNTTPGLHPVTPPMGLPLIGAVFAALTLMSLLDDANLTWLATVYSRNHDFTPRQAGDVLGVIALVGGGAGPLVGGWLADRIFSRHGPAGRIWLCLLACAASTPLLLIYLQPDTGLLSVALTVSAFFLTASVTVGVVVLQQALPARRKGLGTGLFYSALTLVAAGGGTIVALLNDRIFEDPLALPRSVALVTVTLGLLATGCWLAALRLTSHKTAAT